MAERPPLSRSTASKFLIVTADDFGLHRAVNEGIEKASLAGVLSAASLMVNEPATADAVRRAQDLPHLRVGLHLVLADGHAVLSRRLIPDLVDRDGRFGSRMFRDGVRFFLLPALRRQLEAEIRAQFEAFAGTGLLLDHVNAHKHFHLHPTLLQMIVRIGRDYGAPAVRVPQEPLWFRQRGGAAIADSAGALALSPWLSLMKRRLRAAGIAHNDQLFGISCSGSLDESTLLAILARLPPGVTEIYSHPAVEMPGPVAASMGAYRHADELAALLSARVRDAIATAQVACGGYRDLLDSRVSRRAA